MLFSDTTGCYFQQKKLPLYTTFLARKQVKQLTSESSEAYGLKIYGYHPQELVKVRQKGSEAWTFKCLQTGLEV